MSPSPSLRLAILRDGETGVEETVGEEELPADWWMEALLAETCIEAAPEKAREIAEVYNRRGEIEMGHDTQGTVDRFEIPP